MMATAKQPEPPPEDTQPPPEGDDVIVVPDGGGEVQRQVVPGPGVQERDPDDWEEPGDREKGFFPGDPNTYPDPENPSRSY